MSYKTAFDVKPVLTYALKKHPLATPKLHTTKHSSTAATVVCAQAASGAVRYTACWVPLRLATYRFWLFDWSDRIDISPLRVAVDVVERLDRALAWDGAASTQ